MTAEKPSIKYTDCPNEESLKNKVARDFFKRFDCTDVLDKIDFTVKTGENYLLWGEAKASPTDIHAMLAQLVLTIGKARTFDKYLPPKFLACFDSEKIAFVQYNEIQHIFYQSDFNWKVTPSNHKTPEFKLVYEQIKNIIGIVFDFHKDANELGDYIKSNFGVNTETTKISIDKNNFISIYSKWCEAVRPTIKINWGEAKKAGIIDADFYLADLLSSENQTLKEKLFVILQTDRYRLDRQLDALGLESAKTAEFNDGQKAHSQFWVKYERPPAEEYWDYIIERRDLLVPQDIRERKGSFFTPKIWVELSQKYLADALGADWQDEYYIWDCAAGTGNLLAGLTNKYNIWASTLDQADVDVMKDRIDNGANLLKDHIFQFDFLNDEFSKLPLQLQKIINDTEKRKRLVIYINPPYAETMSKGEKHKAGLHQTKTNIRYSIQMGNCANREMFIQFLTRIYFEIPNCIIGTFSTLKSLNAPHFNTFRLFYKSKLKSLFVVPAHTFDNVKGKFPIGFQIWDTAYKDSFYEAIADVYDENGTYLKKKAFHCYDNLQFINEWIITTRNREHENNIGFMACLGNDFQQTNVNFIMNHKNQMASPRGSWVTDKNLIEVSIYYSVRHCIEPTWLNDRDQFLYPNNGWQTDCLFQNDCLSYTLFNNNIQTKEGINFWIPFTENEVNARTKFDSSFMTDFIAGKIKPDHEEAMVPGSLQGTKKPNAPLEFSASAKTVFDAGRELWKYYHAQPNVNVNASLYDIREHFKGRNEKGRMNAKSEDENFNLLDSKLRDALKALGRKIEPKVYEYGFLKR
ncbi:MAG: hypothetical protein FWG02_05470 [Holophagaceae bacterium]|nr:hypothetical protein [Holophagaceae bacterium]